MSMCGWVYIMHKRERERLYGGWGIFCDDRSHGDFFLPFVWMHTHVYFMRGETGEYPKVHKQS